MKDTFEKRMERLDSLIANVNKLTKQIKKIDGTATEIQNDRAYLGRR
jgi:hypothetical protein